MVGLYLSNWSLHFVIRTLSSLLFILSFNTLTAKFFNLNFHPLEVVSRWRDLQLQVSENFFRFDKMVVNSFQILLVDVTFYL